MKQPRGFIALMSAILISAILLIAVVSVGMSGILSRFNVFDAESKNRSAALADACADSLLLQLMIDAGYSGGTIAVGSDSCVIQAPQNPTGNPRIFPIQAIIQNSYTNILVYVDVNTPIITEWREVATLP